MSETILTRPQHHNHMMMIARKSALFGAAWEALCKHDEALRAMVRELAAILKEENETLADYDDDGDCFVCGAGSGERHDVACMYSVIDRAEVVTR